MLLRTSLQFIGSHWIWFSKMHSTLSTWEILFERKLEIFLNLECQVLNSNRVIFSHKMARNNHCQVN